MKYCPECGFELKPGDEFCINCGADLTVNEKTVEEPKKKKKSFFKTPGGIIITVLAVFLIAAGIAAISYFNSPKVRVLRAFKNTAEDIAEDKTFNIIDAVVNEGSIEAEAELKDIIGGFSIPLIGEIDASALVKLYMNAEKDSYQLSASGKLGGTQAVGAELWINPERLVVKSPALIGKVSYGFDLPEDDSFDELEALTDEYLGFDAGTYEKTVKAFDAYSKNKEDINKKLAVKLYSEAFKNGKTSVEKEEITVGGETQKTDRVSLKLSKEQLVKALRETEEELRQDEDFRELADIFGEDDIRDAIDDIPDNYSLEAGFYINKESRLLRVDINSGNTFLTAYLGPDPKAIRELVIEVSLDGDETGVSYYIENDDNSRYSSHLKWKLAEQFCESIGFADIKEAASAKIEGNIEWNKTSGAWTFDTNTGLTSNGTMSYSDEKATGTIRSISCGSFRIDPNIKITVRENDSMPLCPKYITVRTETDRKNLISDITDSIEKIKEQLIGSAADYILYEMFGIGEPPVPKLPETVEPAQEPETEKEKAKPEETEEKTLTIGGFSIGTKDLAMVEMILKLLGVDIDISGMDIDTIQSIIDSLGLDRIDPDVLQGVLSMIGLDPSIMQSIPEVQKENNENKTEPDKNDTIVEDKAVQTEGTYVYDDGKTFAYNPETGEITYHVVCEARLKKDNTYVLKYSDGIMEFEDTGTFFRNDDDTMQFSSNNGINATGKYFDDHIEVTIPGFGTFNIPRR